MFRIFTMSFAVACLSLSSLPAKAGLLNFSFPSCNCGLSGFTGSILDVAANGTSTPTDVVVTGYNIDYFSVGGTSTTPSVPFSTASWTQQSDLVGFAGIPSYTVTLADGILQSINISLTQNEAPNGSLALYYDGSLEYVFFQADINGPQQGFGQISGTPGTTTVYSFVDNVAVPEPVSAALLLSFVTTGIVARRRLRH